MPDRPNLLFIITHDTGRHMGGYGLGVETPRIDALAAEGVRFQNLFCTAPQCSPSRASAITGLMPHSNGMIGLAHRGFRLHPEVATTPKLLGAAGYDTWLFGVQHESTDPATLGYQHRIKGEPNAVDCHCVTAKVLDWLASGPRRPFFASVGFFQTHRVFSDSGDAPTDGIHVPPYLPDEPRIRRDFCDFNLDLAKVDECVGAILDALERAGLVENTLVVFTTDHGVAFPGAKGTLMEPGIGIGGVMRGPGGFDGGREIEALTSNLDFLPTFCELAEVEAPPLHGRSLLPLVRGQVAELRDEVFIELTYHAAYDPMRGVRTRTHKYIRSYEYRPYWFPPNVDDGHSKQQLMRDPRFREMRPRELLFDLVNDPTESRNLARRSECRAVLEDLRGRVDRFMAETGDPMPLGVYPAPDGATITPPTNWNPEHEPE